MFCTIGGLKAIFVGLKATVLALKGAFVAALTALSGFLGIAVAPLVAIIAAIAAVGYALYDTFVEVKKKFDEGASVGELIQTAVVNFYGAFGKLLDFIKDLVADVLEFFGFEDLANTFRDLPNNKILVETDAPYLSPVPLRGKPNEPSYIIHTVKFLSDLKKISFEEFSDTTSNNFFNLFGKLN